MLMDEIDCATGTIHVALAFPVVLDARFCMRVEHSSALVATSREAERRHRQAYFDFDPVKLHLLEFSNGLYDEISCQILLERKWEEPRPVH